MTFTSNRPCVYVCAARRWSLFAMRQLVIPAPFLAKNKGWIGERIFRVSGHSTYEIRLFSALRRTRSQPSTQMPPAFPKYPYLVLDGALASSPKRGISGQREPCVSARVQRCGSKSIMSHSCSNGVKSFFRVHFSMTGVRVFHCNVPRK